MKLRRLVGLFVALVLLSSIPLVAQTAGEGQVSEDDAAALACCAVGTGLMLIIPLLVLVMSIIIAVWMYRDATARGDSQAVLWAVIGLLFNLLGLIIYIIARKNSQAPPPPPPPPAPMG